MRLGRILGLFSVCGILLFQAGCSGGGGGTTTPEPDNYDITVLGPESDVALVGQVVGLVLQAPESNITDINWRQTDGDSVTLLTANTKVVGFEVPAVGSYSFRVSFRDSSGGSRAANYSFTANAGAPNYINARVDFEVNSAGKASVNAYENFPGTLASLSWSQLQGPSVSLTANGNGVSFQAPNVNQDTLIRLQVSASDDQGNQASDTVSILVEPQTINSDRILNSGRFKGIAFADVYAYRQNSPYADVLSNCVYGNEMNEYCTFDTLPAMGMVNPNPTVSEVMDRVLVSHDWMGERFENFLTQIDENNDIKNLLGAATAVVISYDVRPSFFWSGTGAIYIDPNYFWETPEQRDTINQEPDFRSNFDEDLLFQDPWRFVKDNDYAWVSYSLSSRATRSFDDYKYLTARLFIHELAHANDFLPPRVWAEQTSNDYPWTYSQTNNADSTGLDNTFPLYSQEMYGLASVMFHGADADSTQQSYTPAQVSDFFFPDDASNTYNYSTKREDYAMLAEQYIMAYRYGILYDTAITGLAPEYVVSKAERGRVGHDRIIPRAEYVVSRILPSIDTSAASATIPAPVDLETGISWWDSLVPPGQAKNKTSKVAKEDQKKQLLIGRDFHQAERKSYEK